MTDSSWIQPILLIQLIQYKIDKTRMDDIIYRWDKFSSILDFMVGTRVRVLRLVEVARNTKPLNEIAGVTNWCTPIFQYT